MKQQLVEPVHGYESQPQRGFEPSFSLCVSNDLKQPVETIENMHLLNDLSLPLLPVHLLREPLYQHIDSLFGDNVVDWELIKTHWQDLL